MSKEELLSMSLKEIFGLNIQIKKIAIDMLIESIIDDVRYDITSHLNTLNEIGRD